MASDPEVLTVKEVCELLQLHQSTVYKLIKEGKIPAFRIGSDWRFQKNQIVHWIAEQTIGAARGEKSSEPRRQYHLDLGPFVTPFGSER